MRFAWKNKLADYGIEYRCDDDCKMGGCPGHYATFHLNSGGDTFHATFKFGRDVNLDAVEAALLLDFFKKLESDQLVEGSE